jgi:hypothetical protein
MEEPDRQARIPVAGATSRDGAQDAALGVQQYDLLAGRSERGGRAGQDWVMDRLRGFAMLSWGLIRAPRSLLRDIRRSIDLITTTFAAANPQNSVPLCAVHGSHCGRLGRGFG